MKSLILVGVFGLTITCLSCGGYTTNNSNSTGSMSIAGNWQITFMSSHGGATVTVTVPFTQTGSNASGTATITGSCDASGTISASLNGYTLTGTLTENMPETITITGNVTTNYSSVTGTYQVTAATGACSSFMGDSGTWSGTRTSTMSGYFAGMIQPADRQPVGVSVNLNNDAGQLSGTATFTNSACLHSMDISGSVSGVKLELHATGPDGSVVLSGTMDDGANTLALNSKVSGVCSAESGTGSLTKIR